jgi:hypothetical protein
MAIINCEGKISERLQKICSMGQSRHFQVIIELSGEDCEEITSMVNHCNGEIIRRINLLPGLVAKVPLGIIKDLAQSAQVKKIWADSLIRTTE